MPLNPYATKPYCLDSEFLPRHLLNQIDTLDNDAEKQRGEAAYREFIRSLIFSPQVVIGRESTTGHPVLADAVQKSRERDAIIRLFKEDRLHILLMMSRGNKGDRYEERSLLDFFEHSPFRGQENKDAVQAWTEVANFVGDDHIPYVRLNAENSQAMENRFTSFFQLSTENLSLIRCFGDSLGRFPLVEESEDFKKFWIDDLRQFRRWLEDLGQDTLYRSTIYDEYIRPKGSSKFLESVSPNKASEMIKRRDRLRIPFKLMTDLAYNANVPATINIKSFVPPDMPDPVSLPIHLFQAIQFPNPTLDKHQDAVNKAYADLIDRRVEAQENFFYESQTYQQLPDIGSFTISDAVMVMDWPEWKAFKSCQYAALRFENADELEQLMRDYWETIKNLHTRLEVEARKRQHWRCIGTGLVKLSIAVTAHIMGHALLPELIDSFPWWLKVTTATTVAQPIHAGLDIIVHGVEGEGNSKSLRPELGFKDGGMREFTISREMQEKLKQLEAAVENLSMERREQDAVIANASNRIAAEG